MNIVCGSLLGKSDGFAIQNDINFLTDVKIGTSSKIIYLKSDIFYKFATYNNNLR